MTTFRNKPSRGLGDKVDPQDEWNSGDLGRSELQPLGNIPNPSDGKVGRKAQHYAKCHPHLPGHDKCTTNVGRSVFGRKDGHCDFLQAHPDAEEDAIG